MSLLSQASKIMSQDRIKKLGQEREKNAVIIKRRWSSDLTVLETLCNSVATGFRLCCIASC